MSIEGMSPQLLHRISMIGARFWSLCSLEMTMRNPIARNTWRVIRVLAVLVLIALIQFPARSLIQSKRGRTRLLCNTDHHVLLESGRSLLREVTNGNFTIGSYCLRGRTEFPNGVPVPQAIINLSARRLDISEDGHMMIEMHGAMDHFGIIIYPEGFTEPFQGFNYGDRKLIDGLWYYDDEYQMNPDYDKVVDRMLLAGKKGGDGGRILN